MQIKKIISGLVALTVILSLFPFGKAEAAAPTGTLTGSIITVDIGQIKAITAITATDHAVTPDIKLTTGICIRIPAAVNANWDISDLTTVAHGGTASGKASTTVSYPSAKILKIDVTADFAAGETLIISGLSYVGHTAATVAVALDWSVDNAACTGTYAAGNANTQITVADGAEDTLTAVTATSTNYFISVTANYTIAFTVPASGVISKNGKIKVTFPAGFNVAGATAGALTNIDGTVVLGVAGQVVTLTRQDDGTNSLAGAKSVVINNVVNSSVASANYTVVVRTDTVADELLATANSAAFSIIAGAGWSGLVSDVIAPSSVITNPTDGSTILAGEAYTIKGTAKDEGGSLVQKVEISLDGGNTWYLTEIKDIVASEFFWEYVWQNPTEGEYTIKTRATDKIGNIESPGVGIRVTVAAELPSEEEVPEKPITEMTVEEIKAKIVEVQQKIVDLLQQLIQLIQQQISELLS